MSSNIIDNIRIRGNQDRNTINKILAELQDLQSIDAEDEAIEKRIAISDPTRKKSNSIGQQGAPNEVIIAGPRDKRNENITLKIPTACESYPFIHTTNGSIGFDASSGATKYGGGGAFDGANDYITIAHIASSNLDLERTDAFTMFGWIKFNGNLGNVSLIGKNSSNFGGTGFMILVNGIRLMISISNTTSSNEIRVRALTDVSDNTYHSFVMVYKGDSDGTNVDFYIDGTDVSETPQVDNLAATIKNSVDASIGAESDGGGKFTGSLAWTGIIKEAVNSAWATSYHGGHIDLSGGNLITLIPFVGDESVTPEATTGYCVSS